MIRQEAILQSPLRILDLSIRGGLGKGHLGVIMAPPGVGKSACLAQLGQDALLRGRHVLHLALAQTVEHVSARYDALFEELAARVDLADRAGVAASCVRRRLIWSSLGSGFDVDALDRALAAFEAHHGRAPSTILVDGYAWPEPEAAGIVAAVKVAAARVDAELWMTAPELREAAPGALTGLAPLSEACAALVDVGLLLEPQGRYARLTLVKDHDRFPATPVSLVLEGGALHLPDVDDAAPEDRAPEAFTLVTLGSPGAEAAFGSCAERWGLQEVSLTFAGRTGEIRARGRVELGEDELRLGDVSPAYVKAHMHRTYAEIPALRRVLQAIWHQVTAAGEVFAVGALNADETARGGTGWAVELARHWSKPVHLFDQARNGWFRWSGSAWLPVESPRIAQARFAGAGTRALTEDGRAAIEGLFERSFGAAREG